LFVIFFPLSFFIILDQIFDDPFLFIIAICHPCFSLPSFLILCNFEKQISPPAPSSPFALLFSFCHPHFSTRTHPHAIVLYTPTHLLFLVIIVE
jgi:hypothetical protein